MCASYFENTSLHNSMFCGPKRFSQFSVCGSPSFVGNWKEIKRELGGETSINSGLLGSGI